MSSDNPSGADNQQERPDSSNWLDTISADLGHWVAGFVDGEGSFNVPIRRERERRMPWRASLSFNVSQLGRTLPDVLQSTFRVGTVRGRSDDVWYFEITKPLDLRTHVVPFFERFPLRGAKANDLGIFERVLELIELEVHLTAEGLRRILELRNRMNRGGKRHRADIEILSVLRDWESSEAIRRAP